MIKTFLTTNWGLKYPIVSASMTPAATGRLANAVSTAGGLGMIGVNESWSCEDIKRECAVARAGGKPYGVGFFGWAMERDPALLQTAIEERPRFISISFIDVRPYARVVQEAGIALGAQVQTRTDASAALEAGVDVLIAQGTEAGGHTGEVSTLTLLQVALSIAGSTPVIAAGGIATPQGLAAVLAAGAAGGWIGTPFLLAGEAAVPDDAKLRIIESDETQTMLTSLFDKIQGFPWPARFRGRAIRNVFLDEWAGREAQAAQEPGLRERLLEAKRTSNYDVAYIYAGQSIGLLSEQRSAREVVEALGEGAERVLRDRCETLLH